MSFDLNINNYTRDELIQMFELPPNFDRNIFEIKEVKLRDSIINNKEINKDTKVQTMNFLLKAKNIILNNNNSNVTSSQNQTDNQDNKYKLKMTTLEDPSEHMIQVQPETEFHHSYSDTTYKGVLNPIIKRTLTKSLSIDSRFRDNYYTTSATNFKVTLPFILYNVLKMQLCSIELPTSYYAISKQYGNNFFTLSVNGLSTLIQVPEGNYDTNSIINAINQQIIYAGQPYSYVSFAISFTYVNSTLGTGTGSSQTLVGVVTNPAQPVTSIILNFQNDINGNSDQNTPLPLKFGWMLGFRNGIYTNNLNYVSEGILDISGPRYMYLVIDDYNNNVNNSFYSAFNSSMLNANVLARISLNQNKFTILDQNNVSAIVREYFGPVTLQNLNIQLLDEYGRVVDLNNMDFSFCLSLTTAYDL